MEIETSRLNIRLYKSDDYQEWYNGHDNRLPSQYVYDDGRPESLKKYTEAWFHDRVKHWNKLAGDDELYHLGVFRKFDGAHIGQIELYRILRMDYHSAKMGYFIHNQYWKNGYAAESVNAAIDVSFADLDFQRIELHINIDNEPSIKLAEKIGFHYECTRKQLSVGNGEWKDFFVYYRNREGEIT